MTTSLAPLPESFAGTVGALHRVAEVIVAPARKPDNEISLREIPGGFGTPEFEHAGVTQRVRVEWDELVREVAGEERRAPLTSLAVASGLVADLLPADTVASPEPLAVDAESAAALARWNALGYRALCVLRDEADAAAAATNPVLWPEHFDLAIELGDEAAGQRATYGFSPGDENHPEPYAYVGPWVARPAGETWNATGFGGAELGYVELLAAEDPLTAALDFLRSRRDALLG